MPNDVQAPGVGAHDDRFAKFGSDDGGDPARRMPVAQASQQSLSNSPRGRLLIDRADATAHRPRSAPILQSVDAVVISRDGGVFVIGWLDDRADPVESIAINGGGWRAVLDGTHLSRVRREDVEAKLRSFEAYACGYFALVFGDEPISLPTQCSLEISLRSGVSVTTQIEPRVVDASTLRDLTLGYLFEARYFGNKIIKAIECVESGFGEEVISLNRSIVSNIVRTPYIEHFGQVTSELTGSIIVCLFGKADYLFLQSALFAGRPGIGDYEFIFVCNSPELSEVLLEEARLAEKIYGILITIVILPGNAGFAAANNVAASAARTERLVFVNPDVFPKQQDWAAAHTALLRDGARHQTRLFGVPLYYDDGSLMHGGMYFEMDRGCTFEDSQTVAWRLLRVEHYGKGAPPLAEAYTRSRPVPAVTGAFMSIERTWFETLEGFNIDYVFGHYEDADLCLRSLEGGTPVWLHDLRLWHLEGKGSVRATAHEGGSLVNRWHFSTRWGETVSDALLGPTPSHSALRPKVFGA